MTLLIYFFIHWISFLSFIMENWKWRIENYGGFWAWQEPELIDKIKEIEEKHNCLVYAITHEYTEFGELYDFLIVTDYKEEWDNLFEKSGNHYFAFAYVWNKDDDYCSEFGTITLSSFGGGIRRIG